MRQLISIYRIRLEFLILFLDAVNTDIIITGLGVGDDVMLFKADDFHFEFFVLRLHNCPSFHRMLRCREATRRRSLKFLFQRSACR